MTTTVNNPATVNNVKNAEAAKRSSAELVTESVSRSVDAMEATADLAFDKGAEGAARAICAAPDKFALAELAKMGAKSVERAARLAVREAYARRLASRK